MSLRDLWRLALAALGLVTASAASARSENIALTFDDLPALTQTHSQSYVTNTNRVLLRGLRRHHLPAIGFVNEGKFDELDRAKQIDILRMWVAAGMQLGNHTFSHESPNSMTAAAYIADIARGEQVTRPLLARHHQTLKWFRHPYLETGFPLATKQTIDSWLTMHGYHIAPVTMEASDWLFSEPYDDAIARKDKLQAAHIKASYLNYTATTMDWYRAAEHHLLGRNAAFVMLLHVSRLNADCIDELAALLKHKRLHAVTLDVAMKDPAYKRRDTYVGAEGIDWLERWSLALNKELPWESFKDPPQDIAAYYKKVDSDQ